jgi:hypothetical protein
VRPQADARDAPFGAVDGGGPFVGALVDAIQLPGIDLIAGAEPESIASYAATDEA